MHPEDAAAGFHRRITYLLARKPVDHGITITGDGVSKTEQLNSLICDGCGLPIPDGQECVAITMYRGPEPGMWEPEFGQVKS